MDSDEFECTQVLNDSNDKPSEESTDSEKKQVACLCINGQNFAIFNGDSKIGRDPKQCYVHIDKRSVSAHHALIEVESGHHLICDLGSSNSTRLNGMLLKPHVRYNLTDGSIISIADLRGTYKISSSKATDCDTSVQDIFATPAKQDIRFKSKTPNCATLNNSDADDSIIASTPMRVEFKLPFPKRESAAHNVSTDKEADDSSFFDNSLDVSTPSMKKAISSFIVPCSQPALSDSSLNLHYDTDKSTDASGFECEDGHSSAHSSRTVVSTDVKNDHNQSTIPDLDMIYNENTQVVSLSDSINESAAADDDIYGGIIEQELNFIEKKMIEEELDLIERSISSEGNTPGCSDITSRNINRKPSNSGTKKRPIDNQNTSLPNAYNENSIYEADTQVFSDSENDNRSLTLHKRVSFNKKFARCRKQNEQKCLDKSDIYEARTQRVFADNSDADDGGVLSPTTGACSPIQDEDAEDDIHGAKTQIDHANASSSKPFGEEVNASATERSKSKDNIDDDIHNAKTQVVNADNLDSETDEEDNFSSAKSKHESMASPETKKQHKNVPECDSNPGVDCKTGSEESQEYDRVFEDDIHNAKTQVVNTNASDSETDEEGVYGTAPEAPKSDGMKTSKNDIHNAKTQIISTNASDSETDEEGVYGAATEVPKSDGIKASEDDIHNAKTQIVSTNALDSETNEGVYGAATEAPKSGNMKAAEDDINDDNTKASEDDIHTAKTQIVSINSSDSETDEEGVYGAATEAPKSDSIKSLEDDIHTAKTQIVSINASDSETDEEGVYGAATEVPKSNSIKASEDDIHNAKTQIVSTSESDSETDKEGVHGAATEIPKSDSIKASEDDIHNAKTQIVSTNASDSETDEGMYGAEAPKSDIMKAAEDDVHDDSTKAGEGDIHSAKTQMVSINSSDSETDEDGVYGAATEAPKSDSIKTREDDIHTAKTQIISTNASDSETDEEGVYGAATEVPKSNSIKASEDDIHDAKTQIVSTNESDSETDEEGVHGAAAEVPKSDSIKASDDDIHIAKTQIVSTNASDSETDEGMYGAEAPKSDSTKAGEDDIHSAKTQIISTNASDSETDEEGVYGAATEVPKSDSMKASEDDIHRAKTQIVSINASDSETDDEGVCGAHTDAPTCKYENDNHDAKTQIANSASTNNIHDSETQVVKNMDGDESNRSSSTTPDLPELLLKCHTKMSTSSEAFVPVSKTSDHSNHSSSIFEKETSTCNNFINSKLHVGDDIFDAQTQIINHSDTPEKANEDSVDCDIFSAATQVLSSPARSSTEQKEENVDDIFSAATQVLPSPARSAKKKDQKNEDEDIFSAATQVLPSPARSAKKKDGENEDDIFSAATQILPSSARSATKKNGQNVDDQLLNSPTMPKWKQGQNVEGDVFSAVTQLLSGSSGSLRNKGNNVENGIFSAATQKLTSPARSLRKSSNNVEEDIFAASTQKLTVPFRSLRKSRNNVEEDIFSAATQILPGAEVSKVSSSDQKTEEAVSLLSPSTPVLGGDDISDAATHLLSKPGKRSKDNESGIKTSNGTKNSRTTRGTKRKTSSVKRKFGSHAPEDDIEDMSSDSNKSLDHMIVDEGSPEPAIDMEASVISTSPDSTEQDSCGNSSYGINQTNSKAAKRGQSDKSPIVCRSSGRKKLSLNKSHHKMSVLGEPNDAQIEAMVCSAEAYSSNGSPKLPEIMKNNTEESKVLAKQSQALKCNSENEREKVSEPENTIESPASKRTTRRNKKINSTSTVSVEVKNEKAACSSSDTDSFKRAVITNIKCTDSLQTSKSHDAELLGAGKYSQETVRSSHRFKSSNHSEEEIESSSPSEGDQKREDRRVEETVLLENTKRHTRRTANIKGRKDSIQMSDNCTEVKETSDNGGNSNQLLSGRKRNNSRQRGSIEQVSDKLKEENPLESVSSSSPEETDVPDRKSKRGKAIKAHIEEEVRCDQNNENQPVNKVVDSVNMPPPIAVIVKSASQPITQPRQSRRLRKTASQPIEEISHLDVISNKSSSVENDDEQSVCERTQETVASESKIPGNGMESKEESPEGSSVEANGRRFSLAKTSVKSGQLNQPAKGSELTTMSQQDPASEQVICHVRDIGTETGARSVEGKSYRFSLSKSALKSENINQSSKGPKRVSFSQQDMDLESMTSDSSKEESSTAGLGTKRSSQTRKLTTKTKESNLPMVDSGAVNSTNVILETRGNIPENESTKLGQSKKQVDSVGNSGRITRGVKRPSRAIIEAHTGNSNVTAEDSSGSRTNSKKVGRSQKNANVVKEDFPVPEEPKLQPDGLEHVENTKDTDESSQKSNISELQGRRSSRTRKQTSSLSVYDASLKEISEESPKVEESALGSSVSEVKGAKPSRSRKLRAEVKGNESNAKGIKRFSSTNVDHERATEVTPTKVLRQSSSNLSIYTDENSPSTSILDVSAASSSLKRGGSFNDSFASDVGGDRKRRRGRLDSVASTSTSPRRSSRQSLKPLTSLGYTCVLFTGYNNIQHENVVKQLGGAVVDAVESTNVLVTDKLRRTVKLLSTVGRGLPVVGTDWIALSKKAGRLLDPWEHILIDQEAEAKFGMKLVDSIRKAADKPVLQDYNIFITKSVKPIPDEMKAIVRSCGGQILSRMPASWPSNSIVISCREDKPNWSKVNGMVPIVAAEWLLSGVLTQRIENEAHLLRRKFSI